MKIFIILFFSTISFSFQSIQAALYCSLYLREIYLIESDGQKKQIKYGSGAVTSENPDYFPDLQAEQGDKIMFNCYTKSTYSSPFINIAFTYGGGCFLINNICLCSKFENGKNPVTTVSKTTVLDSKSCQISLDNSIVDEGTYSYTYTIPIDARGMSNKDINSSSW